ncbi:MAG: NADP-dependent phosphogluconate dehydrogenase [Cyclobacteriaceae bacterium]
MSNSSFGLIGLGVMGKSLALNVADQGYEVSVYNRAEGDEKLVVSEFLSENSSYANIQGFTHLESFVMSLDTPRKIFLMIKAGPAIDSVLSHLVPLLSHGDIVIDGGNSHYQDSVTRFQTMEHAGIHFVGCGVSGGEEGARKGPSIMPGGTKESYEHIGPILESIAAKDKQGKPCCVHVGESGAGHFVKMIHNGMEYAEMQLLAEVYHLLSQSMSNSEIADLFEKWNHGELASYLLEITVQILRRKEGDKYLVDLILDQASNKGTGSWSSQTALAGGMPTTMMTDAVFARYISTFKKERTELSKLVKRKDHVEILSPDILEEAYQFARIINHEQGFGLIRHVSDENNWNINTSEVARIWTNGCIIRSGLMEKCAELFKSQDTFLTNSYFIKELSTMEGALKQLIKNAIEGSIPTPVFSSALQYWLGATSAKLPANLIQAQRDFFGAHTYKRADDPEGPSHHTIWTE